jgi:hypothetical protein
LMKNLSIHIAVNFYPIPETRPIQYRIHNFSCSV